MAASSVDWDNMKESMADQFLVSNILLTTAEDPTPGLLAMAKCLEEFPTSKVIRSHCFEQLNNCQQSSLTDEQFLYWHKEALTTMREFRDYGRTIMACLEFFSSLDISSRHNAIKYSCHLQLINSSSSSIKDIVAICMLHTHSRGILLFSMRILCGILNSSDSTLPDGIHDAVVSDLLRTVTETLETFTTMLELVCASMNVIVLLYEVVPNAVINSDSSGMMIQVMITTLQEQIKPTNASSGETCKVISQAVNMLVLLCNLGTAQLLSAISDHARVLLLCKALFCLMELVKLEEECGTIVSSLTSVCSIVSLLDCIFKSQSMLTLVIDDFADSESVKEHRSALVDKIRKYLSSSLEWDDQQYDSADIHSSFERVSSEYSKLLATLEDISPTTVLAMANSEEITPKKAEYRAHLGHKDKSNVSQRSHVDHHVNHCLATDSVEDDDGNTLNTLSTCSTVFGKCLSDLTNTQLVPSVAADQEECIKLKVQLQEMVQLTSTLQEQLADAVSRANSTHQLFLKSATKVKSLYEENLELRRQLDGHKHREAACLQTNDNCDASALRDTTIEGTVPPPLTEGDTDIEAMATVQADSCTTSGSGKVHNNTDEPFLAADISCTAANTFDGPTDTAENSYTAEPSCHETDLSMMDSIEQKEYQDRPSKVSSDQTRAGILRAIASIGEPNFDPSLIHDLVENMEALYGSVKHACGNASADEEGQEEVSCITGIALHRCLHCLDIVDGIHVNWEYVNNMLTELESYASVKKLFMEPQHLLQIISLKDFSYILVLCAHRRYTISPLELISRLSETVCVCYQTLVFDAFGDLSCMGGRFDSSELKEEIYIHQQLKVAHAIFVTEKKILRGLYSAYVQQGVYMRGSGNAHASTVPKSKRPRPSTTSTGVAKSGVKSGPSGVSKKVNAPTLNHDGALLTFECLVIFTKDFGLHPTVCSKQELQWMCQQICTASFPLLSDGGSGDSEYTNEDSVLGSGVNTSTTKLGEKHQSAADVANMTLNMNQFSALLLKISLLYFGLTLNPKKKGKSKADVQEPDKVSYTKCLVELFMWLNASGGRVTLEQRLRNKYGIHNTTPVQPFTRSIELFNTENKKRSKAST